MDAAFGNPDCLAYRYPLLQSDRTMAFIIATLVLYLIVQIHDGFGLHNRVFCVVTSWFCNRATTAVFSAAIFIIWIISDRAGFMDNMGQNVLEKFFDGDRRLFAFFNSTFALVLYLLAISWIG